MKSNLTKRMVSFVLAIILLVGAMPANVFATEVEEASTPTENVEIVPAVNNEETSMEDTMVPYEANPTANATSEDVVNITNDRPFTMQGIYLDLLQNHSEYGAQDYLVSEWNDDIRIWFFGDISNVRFYADEKDDDYNQFGIQPSVDVTFMEYVYNKNTLMLAQSGQRTFEASNEFSFTNSFTANFNIYSDASYTNSFFAPSENLPENPILNPAIDCVTETNGTAFTMQGTYSWLLTNHSKYPNKDYIAYELGNEFVILFFDNVGSVKFSVCDKQGDQFGIKASSEVQFTEYIYDKSTFWLKSTNTKIMGSSNTATYSYYFAASFDIYKDESYSGYFYLVNGDLPTLPSPPTVKEEWDEKNWEKFHMPEKYLEVIRECPEYKQGQRYLAYLWENDFVIWFFEDPNVQFSVWDRRGDGLAKYFGVNPSVRTQRKANVYDRNTLELRYENTVMLGKNSGYTLVYDFVSNIDIYTDETYTKYFYKGDSSNVVTNTTMGRTFAISKAAHAIAQNLTIYGGELADKNYIAYSSEDELELWFFDDPTVRLSITEIGDSTFGLQPSSDAQITAYVYDKTTLEHKETKTFTFQKSNDYSFNYNFMANFNVYTDDTHSEYFYNASNSGIELVRIFQPLAPKEAEELLRFISQASIFVNVKKELPDYYNLLIGEINDPEKELETRVRFVKYFSFCMEIQMAEWEEQTNFGIEVLEDWLRGQDTIGEVLIKEILGLVLDDINKITKAKFNTDILEVVDIKNYADAADIAEYSVLIVNALGVARAEKRMSDINYLNVTLNLLETIEKGDEIDIEIARVLCAGTNTLMVPGSNPNKMKEYAGYIYSIMRTLP